MLIVTPIVGFCNYSMFLLCVTLCLFCYRNHLDGKERAGCFTSSSWCLVMVMWLFLTMPGVCLQFVIAVFPDHSHYMCLVLVLLCNKCPV